MRGAAPQSAVVWMYSACRSLCHSRYSVAGRGPPPGPRVNFCLTQSWKYIIPGDKERYFIVKGSPGREQQRKGTQTTALPRGLQSQVLW